MECQENNGTCWQCSISLSISKSNTLIGINKLQIEQMKDASKEIYSDFSIFDRKLFFKECQSFFLSQKFYVNSDVYIIPMFDVFHCF